jgi:hypothetical protein
LEPGHRRPLELLFKGLEDQTSHHPTLLILFNGPFQDAMEQPLD